MKYVLYVFLFIVAYKLTNNASLLARTSYYSRKYNQYLQKKVNSYDMYVPMVTKLFKSAGIAECSFAIAEPVGYGYIRTSTVPHFVNIANLRKDIVSATLSGFEQSKAIFRSRLLETFSPLYWIRAAIFLPKHLFLYLGVSADSVFVKIVQVIYWIVTPLLLAFRDSIYQYITTLFS